MTLQWIKQFPHFDDEGAVSEELKDTEREEPIWIWNATKWQPYMERKYGCFKLKSTEKVKL